MNPVNDYRRFLEDVAGRYRSEGYAVDIQPEGSRVPKFLGGYQPDLIAKRGEESVIIEVKRRNTSRTKPKLKDLAARIRQEAGWRFDIVLYDPDQVPRLRKPSKRLMRESLKAAIALFDKGERVPAVLLAWSVLEAAARAVVERVEGEAHDNLVPADLLKSLVSHGELDEGAFGYLIRLLQVRNRLAHGELAGRVSKSEFDVLCNLINSLIDPPRRGSHAA